MAEATVPISNQSEAVKEQDVVGCDLALEGCISKKWRQQQEHYWKAYKSRKSSRRWMTELLKKLMGIVWDM